MIFDLFKSSISSYLRSGLKNKDDIESTRKVILINFFSSIGFLYLFIFGTISIFNDRLLIGAVITAASFFAFVNFFYLRLTGDIKTSANVVVFIMSSVFIFLLCTGGVENTGPLWCYSSAPLILFLQGKDNGTRILVFLIILSSVVLFYPDFPLLTAEYPEVFKTRFIATFCAVVMMSFIHEYSRQQSYEQLIEASAELDKQARTDPLTQLPNRRDIEDRIKYECKRTSRSNLRYSLLVCDIDYFKQLNDEHGHECGDHVLVEVSKTLNYIMREQDTVSRWGGEEFLILLPDTDYNGAKCVAEKVRSKIEKLKIKYDDKTIHITISVGIGTSDSRCEIKEYIRKADEHLYQAKNKGRNCVVGYDE